MKKFFAILILFGLLNITSTTYANLPTPTKATRENLLEDATIELLKPQMYSAVEDYYGTTRLLAFQCLKVVDIKKLHHSGSWLFEIILEGMTYTGAHHPLDIFTITIKKDWETEGKWVVQEYKVRKYDPNEKYECRHPA